MPEEKKDKKKLINKLTHKYRVVLFNDSTFKEVGYVRLTRLNTISVAGILVILFIGLVWSVIAYTSIREFIPGYPDTRMRNNIIQNKIRLDSLEQELNYRDNYFANLNKIIAGERPEDYVNSNETPGVTARLDNSHSLADSILRQEIEALQSLSIKETIIQTVAIKPINLHFFTPVRGMVTNSFNPGINHYGTDIVAGPNEVVKATLNGTVTMASWTLETGHVIQIQHDNNIISIYKHNAELLKKVGVRVKAGDAIAIIGNSGEYTTGPHLHFEIWQNGVALNPEDFIVF